MSLAIKAPFLRNIALMMTYKCTIACPHCVVEGGPHRREEVKLSDAVDWIKQVKDYRNGHILGLAITGGEPFYNLENLTKISEFANSQGLIVSVVTNAFWATTEENAAKIIEDLPAIQMISFSTDTYHKRAIPVENIKNGVSAAKKADRLYNIAVCTDNLEDVGFKEIISDLDDFGEKDTVRTSITFPVGRAEKFSSRFNYEFDEQPTPGGCDMASYPVIFPDGKVLACIGPLLTLPPTHPLFLGDLRHETLKEILDRAETNPILHAIRIWGPKKLVQLLEENGFGDLLPQKYVKDCICDSCFKLFSNEQIKNALTTILNEDKTRETIAYARLYYFHETNMLNNS
jgi:organic radical activating enzyme